MHKNLTIGFIRLSSMGDIVLTSAAVRCFKNKYPNASIHIICRKQYADLWVCHPLVHQIHHYEDPHLISKLKTLELDYLVDFQSNFRSKKLCFQVGAPVLRIDKFSFSKLKMIWLKSQISIPPFALRCVDTLAPLDISYDGKGLDFFLPEDASSLLKKWSLQNHLYDVAILGAQHYTKKMPNTLWEQVLKKDRTTVLLGGIHEFEDGKKLSDKNPFLINLCGSTQLLESATILAFANQVLAHDTGMMHIASAFQKRLGIIWGNTVPEFGMAPLDASKVTHFEVKHLSCRPCSKIGYNNCPKGHFHCMNHQNIGAIKQWWEG